MARQIASSTRSGPGRTGGEEKLTLPQLGALCDDPARDQPGGSNVRAVLIYIPERGFFLSALDRGTVHQVTDEAGKQIQFRTIEGALAVLLNMAGLDPDIGLFQAASSGKPS